MIGIIVSGLPPYAKTSNDILIDDAHLLICIILDTFCEFWRYLTWCDSVISTNCACGKKLLKKVSQKFLGGYVTTNLLKSNMILFSVHISSPFMKRRDEKILQFAISSFIRD